jgi:hypothetical protein
MFLMNSLLAVNGIVWATPIADFIAHAGGNRNVYSILEKDEIRTVKSIRRVRKKAK